jgi:hypothetical protein
MEKLYQSDKITSIISVNAELIAYIIAAILAIIFLYNVKDMVRNWFIGECIKLSKSWEENDIIDINGERCIIRKFGTLRIFCYKISDDDRTLTGDQITIAYGDFISGHTKQYGKLI